MPGSASNACGILRAEGTEDEDRSWTSGGGRDCAGWTTPPCCLGWLAAPSLLLGGLCGCLGSGNWAGAGRNIPGHQGAARGQVGLTGVGICRTPREAPRGVGVGWDKEPDPGPSPSQDENWVIWREVYAGRNLWTTVEGTGEPSQEPRQQVTL